MVPAAGNEHDFSREDANNAKGKACDEPRDDLLNLAEVGVVGVNVTQPFRAFASSRDTLHSAGVSTCTPPGTARAVRGVSPVESPSTWVTMGGSASMFT